MKVFAKIFDLPSGENSNPYWIHCASGEFEYAKPVIRGLLARGESVYVSYSSPSYQKQIQCFPGITGSFPLPLDFPGSMNSVIRHLNPKAVLFSRTDFWPGLLAILSKRQIPTYAFAVTQKRISSQRLLYRTFRKFILSYFTKIFVASDADKLNLLELGIENNVFSIGDTRYDQVIDRIKQPLKEEIHYLKTDKAPTLILGSVWPQDINALMEGLCALKKEISFRVIIQPHEVQDHLFQQVSSIYKKHHLTLHKYSENLMLQNNDSDIYVDTVGVLADLYRISDIAFVGGSFRSQVHSVMEPLATGCITFVGPKNQNNREAQEFKNISTEFGPMVQEILSFDDFATPLKNLIANHSKLSSLKTLIQQKVVSFSGASKKLTQKI